jgi:pentatricopeptide repeat protein
LSPTAGLKFIRVSSQFCSSTTKADNKEASKELNLSDVTDYEMGSASIEKLCKIGNLSAAVHLLRELTDKPAHISVSIYNSLMNSAIDANDFNLFSEVFKYLLLSRSAPNVNSYGSVAKAFEMVLDSEKILNFIRDLCEITKDREPTVMNQIIFAMADSGQMDKAMLVFKELKMMNSNFDLVTFNTVLGILGKAGLVDQMLSEFEAMKDLGFSPDIITYNSIINSLRRLGKFKTCIDVAREMSGKGIEMDLITYTALIDSLGRAGLIKDAISLFERMKQFQRPSIYVYRALISNLRKAGNFELAMKLSNEMELNFSQLLGPGDFKGNLAGRNSNCKK